MKRKEAEQFVAQFKKIMNQININPGNIEMLKDFLKDANINQYFAANSYFEKNQDNGVFEAQGFSEKTLKEINDQLTLKHNSITAKYKGMILMLLEYIKECRENIRSFNKNYSQYTKQELDSSVSELTQSIESVNESLDESDEMLEKAPKPDLKELHEELEDLLDNLPDTRRILLTLSIKAEQAVRSLVGGIDKLIKGITQRKTNREFPEKFKDLTQSLLHAVVVNKENNVKKLTKEVYQLIENTSNKKALNDEAKHLFKIFIAKEDTPANQKKIFAAIIEKMDVKVNKLNMPKVKKAFSEGAKEARKERRQERKENRADLRVDRKRLKKEEKDGGDYRLV